MMLAAAIFSFVGFLCVLSVIAGLPGTWMMLAMAVGIELLDHHWMGGPYDTFGWGLLAGILVVAIFGEALEIVSASFGTKLGGGTRRGMVGAIGGGMAGALFGTFLIPIPMVGTITGALLGTFGGAMAGEMTSKDAPKDAQEALVPALSATMARALGTIAKGGIAGAVWAVLSVAAFWG